MNVNHALLSFELLKIYLNNKAKTFWFNYELSIVLIILNYFNLKIRIIKKHQYFSAKMKQFFHLSRWDRFVIAPLIKFFYDSADYVINQSQGMRDDLISMYQNLKKVSNVIFNQFQII